MKKQIHVLGVVQTQSLRWIGHIERMMKSRMPGTIMARTVAKEEERTAERKVEDRSDKRKKMI